MELWIRSQDKEKLINVNDVYISKYGKAYTVLLFNEVQEKEETNIFVNCDEWVGKYKSKERALEVLDEIQSILNLKDMYKYDRELVLKGWENVDEEQVKIVRQQMSVYEMPKE